VPATVCPSKSRNITAVAVGLLLYSGTCADAVSVPMNASIKRPGFKRFFITEDDFK
jgi:hypothetical protein